jgi:hypothetical protein
MYVQVVRMFAYLNVGNLEKHVSLSRRLSDSWQPQSFKAAAACMYVCYVSFGCASRTCCGVCCTRVAFVAVQLYLCAFCFLVRGCEHVQARVHGILVQAEIQGF